MVKKLKRIFLTILCVVLGAFVFAGCGDEKPQTPGNNGGTEQEKPGEKEEEKMLCKTDAYKPFWKEKKIRNESVVMVLGDDGRITGKLLFAPTRVISVNDYTLTKTYDPSQYVIEGNTIIAKTPAAMPYFTEDQLEGKDLDRLKLGLETYDAKANGEKIVFTEGDGIIKMQTMVTYEYDGEWKARQTPQPEAVEHSINKLKTEGKMTLALYGDSIAAGCHSSDGFGLEPHQVPFGKGVKSELESQFGGEVKFENVAVGGWRSSEGKENFEERFRVNGDDPVVPDMAIIAFGMNDGSFRMDPDLFGANIEFIVDSIRAINPDCDIVLVATVVPNPLSPQDASQAAYLPVLKELAGLYNAAAVVDMTTVSQELFKVKRGVDVYANNINHPSDFLQRLYVTNIMSALVKDY